MERAGGTGRTTAIVPGVAVAIRPVTTKAPGLATGLLQLPTSFYNFLTHALKTQRIHPKDSETD